MLGKVKGEYLSNTQDLISKIFKYRNSFMINPNSYDYDLEKETFEILTEIAKNIRSNKAKTYKDSWRKHGWMLSVFPNIARKYDRLLAIFLDLKTFIRIFEEQKINPGEEGVIDTFVDLGNYCFLAASRMMVTHPVQFDAWLNSNGFKTASTSFTPNKENNDGKES